MVVLCIVKKEIPYSRLILRQEIFVDGILKKILCEYIFGNIPYNQNYWWALYLAIYSKNAIDGILNWQFWVFYGKKSMVIV